MRLWPLVLLAAAVPFIAVSCSADDFDGYIDLFPICSCVDGKPEQDCVDEWKEQAPHLAIPLDPVTCPDAGADADTVGCLGGTCVPEAPKGWVGPVLVANAPALDLPACPEGTSEVFYGWSDPQPLLEPPTCPTCACEEPPKGACRVPTAWSIHAEICQVPSPVSVSFDAPPDWDGSCTAVNAIPDGKLCGGVPCVHSLDVEVTMAVGNECQVKTNGNEELPEIKSGDGDDWALIFGNAARACQGEAYAPCPVAQKLCAPAAPLPFRICTFAEGDVDCPETWKDAERQVYYEEVADHRACTECGCSPPEGGSCVAEIRVFGDDICTNEVLHSFIDLTSGPGCDVNLMQGIGLGSKEAAIVVDAPGTCKATGGEPTGDVELGKATTFCCSS
jgi:hypothetical protein